MTCRTCNFTADMAQSGKRKHKEEMEMDLYRDPSIMDPEELRAYLADVREELEAMEAEGKEVEE